MSRKFLPAGEFGIESPRQGSFTPNDASLLGRLGSQMNVREALTEGRVPTPVSRAFTFYTNLFDKGIYDDGSGDGAPTAPGRRNLQLRARQAFRGILATFALRDVLGFEIELKEVHLSPQTSDLGAGLSSALASAPGGEEFWNPVRLYTIREGNGPQEVFVGCSPLTGFFPAARAPQALRGLYWYSPPQREGDGPTATWMPAQWYDPTGEHFGPKDKAFTVSRQTKTKVRQLVQAWLQTVLRQINVEVLRGFGMRDANASALLNELRAWSGELERVAGYNEGPLDVIERPVAGSDRVRGFPLFSFAVQGPTAERILTDLPEFNGRLVVTAQRLRDANTRIYGRELGRNRFTEEVVQQLPTYGDNLGEALNLGAKAIPRPYVVVDGLFTPYITTISQSTGFSSEWKGLKVTNGGQTEYALFPFRPQILEMLPAGELSDRVSAAWVEDESIVVKLRFGDGEPIAQVYSLDDGAFQIDSPELGGPSNDEVDLRFFPDFDLDAARHLLPDPTDHQFHARARLLPSWQFDIEAFKLSAGSVQMSFGKRNTMGTEQPGDGGHFAPGRAHFFEFDERPTGFHFTDRGMCLLNLKPVRSDLNPAEWEVSVDFGTSNTCIAFRESGKPPQVLDLPIMTTTLRDAGVYVSQNGEVFEGAAAALDFFYRFNNEETQLKRHDYFPTQVLTQQSRASAVEKFSLENGLIQHHNLSLSDATLWELVEGFPEREVAGTGKAPQKRFRSVNDIKWTDTDWLSTFMHHLRKQVVLTAARQNARVDQIYFSYPKAFDLSQKQRFGRELKKVWGSVYTNGSTEQPLISESEAVRNTFVQGANEHVIFDVGGGTTDIIAFSKGEPVFQTSFKLAAGLVNDYVVTSHALRRSFLTAAQNAGDISVDDQVKSAFVSPVEPDRRSKEYQTTLQIWFGLLEQIDQKEDSLSDVLNELRTQKEDQEAIHGFFLSLVLLFCGVAYFAGRLMKTVEVEGRSGSDAFGSFTPERVTLHLTGNGSRLYNFLNNYEAPFQDVLVSMFKKGYGSEGLSVPFEGIHKFNGREAPKTSVAIGMLTKSAMGDGGKEIYVANKVAEEGYRDASGQTVDPGSDLVAFYQSFSGNPHAFRAPSEVPPVLQAFLTSIDEALPYGKNGQFAAVPYAGKQWTDRLASELYPASVPEINDRVLVHNVPIAKELEQLQPKDHQALEPLFIVELAALLDTIRKRYAT
jgi:hypothetical protein